MAKTSTLLLPSLLDEIANSDPSRILYSVAKSKDAADGFDDIPAEAFARAVDACAWFIHQSLGPGTAFPTLVYLGPQDLNYAVSVLASIKTGYKLLLISPRNTLEAQLHLLDKTECHIFLGPADAPLPVVKQILAARPMRHIAIPAFRYWLHGGETDRKPYPYAKTYLEASGEPFVVLHTSGSTGLPKPVIQTHGTVAAVSALMHVVDVDTTFPFACKGKRVYAGFPLFHCAGINFLLPGSLYIGYTTVLASYPPSADVINSVHVHGNVQLSTLAPTMLEELVKVPEYLENLSRLEQICYGGGPVPKPVGDLAVTKTRLTCCLGTTECGMFPSRMCPDPQDWSYLRMDPIVGYEYRQVSEELYEQVIVRSEERVQYQGIFSTFPDLTEYPMQDLYTKHPDPAKGDHWQYKGRADDIIVFSTGEKLNPNDMEAIINSNPLVKSALIAGLGRFQTSLIVEPVTPPEDEDEKQRLLNAVWPSVQAANKESPSHGRIHREMIIFTSSSKPFPRAGKGTVQRRAALELYSAELDLLYKAADVPIHRSSIEIKGVRSRRDVEAAVKDAIASGTELEIDNISSQTDLFELGLDSLQVSTIVKKLNEFAALHGLPQAVTARIVYANPSLAALSEAVSVVLKGEGSGMKGSTENLDELFQRHSSHMPISGRDPLPKSLTPIVVLLTGSTGSLGSYILDALQADLHVSRIICLCRGPGSFQRQQDIQGSRGLRPLSYKVQCLDVDLSKSYFGLASEQYKELLNEVTHVIHNAWQVDFNLSIQSFGRHIETVRRLIDFSSHSRFAAELFFVSSISAVSGLSGKVMEKVYEEWSAAEATGYGQSKLLSERLLDMAAREANIPSTICRVGQIAGPTWEGEEKEKEKEGKAKGMWPKKEWLPSLIASSKYLGMLPDTLGRQDVVDWIPVDKTAEVLVELALHPPRARPPRPENRTVVNGAKVYHAVNPHRTTWAQLVPTVLERLNMDRGEKTVELVSLRGWVDTLRDSASASTRTGDGDDVMTLNPAIKLLDTFESLLEDGTESTVLETERAVEVSPTLSSIGPVRDEWMDCWMRQWAF
ncbi:hypothetical protein F5Y17DRAFT_468272 [Xylariaceae sp. FL0594]|nr:hypothetical protein F5Y17DRAFT_468272 [Xylariaceae sp. FL0594]